jgi:hypothetical protein
MSKKVVITQSNYIPWKGYFDAVRAADLFVLYDDAQYTRRDWRNRNLIKTQSGLAWLTVPVEVKGKFEQSIKETKISEKDWHIKHWKTLKNNYAKAAFFREVSPFFEELYLAEQSMFLSVVNKKFLESINSFLGIKTPVCFSSDFELAQGKTERLVDLCKKVKATDYYTGPAAKAYLDEGLFEAEGIKLHYFDYSGYPEYPQLYAPFVHQVSILDLIFNTGLSAINFMKNF